MSTPRLAHPWHTRTDKSFHGSFVKHDGWKPVAFQRFGAGLHRFHGEEFLVPRNASTRRVMQPVQTTTIGGRLRGKFQRLGLV